MKTVVNGEKRPSLDDQIDEVQRELAMRERVYPQWIKAGRLSSAKAYAQTRNLRAALDTLQWLRKNADNVRAAAIHQKEGAQ